MQRRYNISRDVDVQLGRGSKRQSIATYPNPIHHSSQSYHQYPQLPCRSLQPYPQVGQLQMPPEEGRSAHLLDGLFGKEGGQLVWGLTQRGPIQIRRCWQH